MTVYVPSLGYTSDVSATITHPLYLLSYQVLLLFGIGLGASLCFVNGPANASLKFTLGISISKSQFQLGANLH